MNDIFIITGVEVEQTTSIITTMSIEARKLKHLSKNVTEIDVTVTRTENWVNGRRREPSWSYDNHPIQMSSETIKELEEMYQKQLPLRIG